MRAGSDTVEAIRDPVRRAQDADRLQRHQKAHEDRCGKQTQLQNSAKTATLNVVVLLLVLARIV